MSRTALKYAPVPQANSKLTHAERVAHRDAKAAADLVDTARSIEERRALRTGANIEQPTSRRGEGPKPAVRLDGLDFLAKQKVLTPEQYRAGRKWAALFGLCETGDLQSIMGAQEVRAQVHDLDPMQRRLFARMKLDEAKRCLNGHDGMIASLDAVCGLGKRPGELSGDRRANAQAANFLHCALSILAKHWGV